MQEGSLRCDVNISLRAPGSTGFGTRTETKNLNSFSSVRAALAYEYERQSEILDAGGEVLQETLHFDADTGETRNMRGKENADDYRYFREPDLPGVLSRRRTLRGFPRAFPNCPHRKGRALRRRAGSERGRCGAAVQIPCGGRVSSRRPPRCASRRPSPR